MSQPELDLIPSALDTPEFRKLWQDWVAEHGGRRYTARQRKMALRKMEPWGAEAACAAIIHSLAGGYRGVFQDPDFARRKSGAPQKQKPLSTWEIREKLRAINNRLDDSDLYYASTDPAKEEVRKQERRVLAEKRKQLKAQLLET